MYKVKNSRPKRFTEDITDDNAVSVTVLFVDSRFTMGETGKKTLFQLLIWVFHLFIILIENTISFSSWKVCRFGVTVTAGYKITVFNIILTRSFFFFFTLPQNFAFCSTLDFPILANRKYIYFFLPQYKFNSRAFIIKKNCVVIALNVLISSKR